MPAPIASMNGLLYSLGLLLEDAARLRVSATGTITTFTVGDLAGIVGTDELEGSEIWFETTTGMTGRNPFAVLGNTTAGVINLDHAYGAASPAVNHELVLLNIRSSGVSHDQRYYAVLAALADLNLFPRASVTVTLDTTNSLHTIPAGIDTVLGFEYLNSSGRTVELPPSSWASHVNPATRSLYLPYDFSGGQTLKAYGRTLWAEPVITDYNAALTKRPNEVVRGALAWLRSGNLDRSAQANAARMTELFFRRSRTTLRANEIVLAEI
jgi:hypothetical protein